MITGLLVQAKPVQVGHQQAIYERDLKLIVSCQNKWA